MEDQKASQTIPAGAAPKRKKLSKRALYRTALLHAIDERESLADAYGGEGDVAERAFATAAEYRRLLREDYGEEPDPFPLSGRAVPMTDLMNLPRREFVSPRSTNKETDQ